MDDTEKKTLTPKNLSAHPGAKVIIIFILILALLIPLAMIQSIINERNYRKEGVISEISSKWGGAQTISGPVITIPYKWHYVDSDGQDRVYIKHMHFMPEELVVSGSVEPEIRYRGIYRAVLYSTDLVITGQFLPPDYKGLGVAVADVEWSGATITLGIEDMRGIVEQIDATFNGADLVLEPGAVTAELIKSGANAGIEAIGERPLPFKFAVKLKGSQQLMFIPAGKETRVSISSVWPNPSFDGSFLPAERSIHKDGFDATWKVFHINRNFPQKWIDNKYNFDGSSFGVRLYTPVDVYQKSTRTTKYAALFITLTFAAFFFSEVLRKIRVHPIQYLMVGFAISIFYTLLISISEHSSFGFAYFLSSVAIVALITAYSRSVLRSGNLAALVGGTLTVLYGYLYVLIQVQDFALLLGSIGLFIALALAMYLTRDVDWYDIKLND